MKTGHSCRGLVLNDGMYDFLMFYYEKMIPRSVLGVIGNGKDWTLQPYRKMDKRRDTQVYTLYMTQDISWHRDYCQITSSHRDKAM